MIGSYNYSEFAIHSEMLRDRIRCEAYQQAIYKIVKPGDVVLDIGTGTGIMAIFAARAGAKKVYAVERTDVAKIAREFIAANGAADRIEVIQSDIETVDLPEKMDVITSEWIGLYGVEENLLPAILQARDRWLKPGGKMIPEQLTSWIAPVFDRQHDEESGFFARGAYGLDMKILLDRFAIRSGYDFKRYEADVIAPPQPMWEVDVYRMSVAQAESAFKAHLTFRPTQATSVNMLAAFFTCGMGAGVRIDTLPQNPTTHWGRSTFPLRRTLAVAAGEAVELQFVCQPAGIGYTHEAWSVRVGAGEWAHYGDLELIHAKS